MKLIDTGQIVDPTSQQPFTGKSLDFLQQSMTEITAAMAYALIGANYSASTIYVLSGCAISAGVIGNGYVFWNGQVYTMIGANTAGYADVPVIDLQLSYDLTIDPVTFSDGVNKYIHEINLMYVRDDVSGSGTADYADVVFVNRNSNTSVTCTSTSTTGSVQVTGSAWTTPARITNFKITVTARVSVTTHASAGVEAVLKIRNVTTATTLSQNGCAVGSSIPAGYLYSFPLSVVFIARDIAASTSMELRLESSNALAPAVVVDNCYLTYEEIRD
jgi:hypothetical protein